MTIRLRLEQKSNMLGDWMACEIILIALIGYIQIESIEIGFQYFRQIASSVAGAAEKPQLLSLPEGNNLQAR